MTERELLDLVAIWQHRLGLDRWVIEPHVRAFDRPEYAATHRSLCYEHAMIEFQPFMVGGEQTRGPDMLDVALTPAFLEAIVVHELLHLPTTGLNRAHDLAEDHCQRDAWRVIDDAWDNAMEGFVDALARSLVEFSPVHALRPAERRAAVAAARRSNRAAQPVTRPVGTRRRRTR